MTANMLSIVNYDNRAVLTRDTQIHNLFQVQVFINLTCMNREWIRGIIRQTLSHQDF